MYYRGSGSSFSEGVIAAKKEELLPQLMVAFVSIPVAALALATGYKKRVLEP